MNVDDRALKAVEAKLSNPPPNIFSEAQEQVSSSGGSKALLWAPVTITMCVTLSSGQLTKHHLELTMVITCEFLNANLQINHLMVIFLVENNYTCS